ncbi:MAG: class I tRNA ligase family protein, partial [Rickettsiaceae bacterium]|nr:class I tRNA ligase family protein [Rickettsiaceae bacterium]
GASKKYLAKELEGGSIIANIKGKELENLSYTPIFDYFKNHESAFKTLCADFVTDTDGTGIVHIAPGFGEDDFLLCKQHNIELVCPVDNAGNFTNEIADFEGINVLESNDRIIIKLKHQGNWLATEQYLHNYPHCWRTDTPLIYKAVSSWYLKVTDFKDRMVENNKQINWIPSHVRDGLFGNWLENAKDWNISRNRFWGTPIPIWMSDDPNYPRIDVYGSIEELEKDFGAVVTDLHKEHLDKLTRINPDDPSGKSVMRRVEDVFDCWFESGSMPYAQMHYPFENKEYFEQNGPADFIVEYVAQTRGWFYTLMVLSTALFDRPPFLNCICHGVILDVKGQKLSKRLNNYADPLEIIAKYGSDALRLTMLSSSVAKGEELLIDKDGHMVFEALRLHIRPIWQAYHFFTIYANIDNIRAKIINFSDNVLDKYILAKLKNSIANIEKALDMFDSQRAYSVISDFFEILNNWYIRRSRNRFWGNDNGPDKLSAYDTLYSCLVIMSKAFSPLLPFLSEELYLNLTIDQNDIGKSVHLDNFPKLDAVSDEENLVTIMDLVRDICSTGLFIRNSENIRSRQPLQKLTIVIKEYGQLQHFEHLIKDELNVKEILYARDVSQYGKYKLTLNHAAIAKRLSDKMKSLIAAAKNNDWKIEGEKLLIANEYLNPEEYNLLLEAFDKGANKALSNNDGIILLDTSITPELFLEGIAKDIIRTIQKMRKEADLNIEDRIVINIAAQGEIFKALTTFKELIEEQTLSNIQLDQELHSHNNYIHKDTIEYMNTKVDFVIVNKI